MSLGEYSDSAIASREIKKIERRFKRLLAQGMPFARHVSVCGDRSFQTLAEKWMERVEKELAKRENRK